MKEVKKYQHLWIPIIAVISCLVQIGYIQIVLLKLITKLALPIGGERKTIQQLLTFLPVSIHPPGSMLKHGDVMFERNESLKNVKF